MLTQNEARQIALAELPDDMVILDEHTVERPFAWVFAWTSRAYAETGNFLDAIVGNGPLFISKTNGEIARFGTYLSMERMIEKYEEEREQWWLNLIEAVYHDAKRMRALREVMGFTIAQLAARPNTLAKGGYERLRKLQRSLAKQNIATDLVLSSQPQ